MMNPEVKKEWVKALCSGDYKQGLGYLQVDGGFCCLGVLCDLAAKRGIVKWEKLNDEADVREIMSVVAPGYGGDVAFPPVIVAEWAGLDGVDASVDTEEDGRRYLSNLNDDGMPFSEIAELIEAQL